MLEDKFFFCFAKDLLLFLWLTSNKLCWIRDQLTDVSTQFYTLASWTIGNLIIICYSNSLQTRIIRRCFCRDLLHQWQSYHDSLVLRLLSISYFFFHITYISHNCHHCWLLWHLPLVFVVQDLLGQYCYHSSKSVVIVIFEVLIF